MRLPGIRLWHLVNTKLGVRLSVLMLAATIPPMLAGTLLLNVITRNHLQSLAVRQLAANAETLAIRVEEWTRNLAEDTRFTSQQPGLVGMDPIEHRKMLLQLLKTHPHFTYAHTIGPDGMNVARGDGLPLMDFHDREYFVRVMSGEPLVRQTLVKSRSSQQPALNYAAAIIGPEGKTRGVLVIGVDLAALSRLLKVGRFGSSGYACLVDEAGQALAHPDQTSDSTLQDLRGLPPVRSVLHERVSRGHHFQDDLGATWLAHSVPVPNGWSAISFQRDTEVFALAHELAVASLAVVTATGLLMVLCIWLVSRRLTGPIRQITTAAQRIAAGEWKQRIPQDRRDELGCLARAFNSMVDELEKTYRQIEEKVNERTEALSAANHRLHIEIGERKQAEETMRTRMAAIDAAADMVVITDRNATIEYVNPAFTRATGYSLEEAIGQNPRLLRGGCHEPAFYASMWRTILAGRVWSGEMINRRKDGSLYPEEMTITPIPGDAGNPVRFVAIKRDITARKKAAELVVERRCLREAVQAMEHVLGVVAHELRTPLAGIRAIAELLLNEERRRAGDSQGLLQGLHDESVRMAGTINDLLEAARINSGRAKWNWSQVDLEAVCGEAMETVKPLVRGPEVKLSCSVAPKGLAISGDPEAVRRLVVNLLSNSAKHTISGAIRVTVRQDVREDHPGAQITVYDTGCGIPQALLEHLGEAFALNSGVVGIHHAHGTGLGLAICGAIAAVHGGRISVQSVVGSGTTISVFLRADLAAPLQPNAAHHLAGFAREDGAELEVLA